MAGFFNVYRKFRNGALAPNGLIRKYVYQIPIKLSTENCFLPMICNKKLFRQESKKKFKITLNQQNFIINVRILVPQLEKKS